MKKKPFAFFLLVLAAFSQFSLSAQNNYTILENSKDKIRISISSNAITSFDVKTDKGNFSRIAMDNFLSTVSVGNPELPLFVCQLEIPICESVQMTVTPGSFTTYTAEQLGINYPIFPVQPSYSKNIEGPVALVINSDTYGNDEFYGQNLAEITKKGIFRSVNIAELNFAPVQYNPVSNQFKVYESVVVEITFTNPNFTETQRIKNLYDNDMFGFVSRNLINAQDNRLRDEMSSPIKMVIVAHSSFRGQLDDYVAWKKRKGFLVEIAYTDDANVGTTTTSIKNYLQGLYDNATAANPAPTFLLLVGDVAQIPTFSGTAGSHYTDLYYATYTTGDHYPDCIYGRFSAENLSQLTPQIDKTLMYEQYTMENTAYLNDAVLVAGTDANWAPTHANGQMNYLSNNYINTANGYSNVHLHLYPASSQAAQIRSEIGAGVGYANYTAHCGVDGWADPSFSNSDVSSMNNANKYGLMVGNCCQSNTFYSTCLGEVLLRTPNKGAVGYLGGSNNTYWDEDFYWSVGARSSVTSNPSYNASALGAYDRLFHTHNESHAVWNVTAGGMNLAGNWAVDNSSSSYEHYYWEIYHLMGDPSIMPYLSEPDELTVSAPSALMVGANTLTVSTEPYAYVALTYDNELIGAAFADAN